MAGSGEIKITDEVISSIAGAAASSVEGVHGLSGGVVEGISAILGNKSFSKGISVNLNDAGCTIEINLIAQHGFKIQEVAKQVQQEVKKDVKNMIGLKVDNVNVYVDGVKIPKPEEQKESEEGIDAENAKLITDASTSKEG